MEWDPDEPLFVRYLSRGIICGWGKGEIGRAADGGIRWSEGDDKFGAILKMCSQRPFVANSSHWILAFQHVITKLIDA